METSMPTTQSQLAQDLLNLGVHAVETLMVHASLRAIGPIEGGAQSLVEALLDATAPGGNAMAYVGFEPTNAVPYFDPKESPARAEYGVLAETIRGHPHAIRSVNPGASMAAIGAQAEWLCGDHPLNYGYGPGSPLEKLVQLNGKVLLLGSNLDHVTLLHFAEYIAPLSGKRVVHREFQLRGSDATPKTITVEEFDTSKPVLNTMPEKLFEQITLSFIANRAIHPGLVGAAHSYLLPAKELVEFAVDTLVKQFGAPV